MLDRLSLPVSIILAGLLIGGGIYLNGRIASSDPTPAQQGEQARENFASSLRPIDSLDHILGSSDARVVVVEYSDTECPFCKSFHSTMLSVMQQYGKSGDVAWVYRHLPLESLHQKSFKEAVALECAASLGGNSKFWEYANKIYEVTPSNDSLDPAQLPKIAATVGLSSEAFNACLAGTEFDERIRSDMQNAGELGIEGTPYSIIVDTKNKQYYPIPGAYPYFQMKQVIDMILSS